MESSEPEEDWQRHALSIRVSQFALNDLLKMGLFKTPIHLAMGHELVALAVQRARNEGDPLILPHRNLHYQLAMGVGLESLVAEGLLLGGTEYGGRTGIMNMMSTSRGNLYTSSILGNNLPVACGVALADKTNHRDQVTWVVTGDGAIEEGAFAECLLLASSLNLPTVFLIEDNGWSLATHISQRRYDIDLQLLASAYGCRAFEIDGTNWASLSSHLPGVRSTAVSGTPCVVRLKLTTLGGRWVEDADGGTKRLINYHAGVAPESALSIKYPIFSGDGDPLEQLPGQTWFSDYLCELLSEAACVLRHLDVESPW